jgi:MFS family permease
MVLTSTTNTFAAIVGPLTAGLLLASIGVRMAFIVTAVSCFAVVGIMNVVGRPTKKATASCPDGGNDEGDTWWSATKEAVAHPWMRPMLMAISIAAFLAFPVSGLAAVVATKFGASPLFLNLVLSATGLGALVSKQLIMRIDTSGMNRSTLIGLGIYLPALLCFLLLELRGLLAPQ